jgi:hypothetical protein
MNRWNEGKCFWDRKWPRAGDLSQQCQGSELKLRSERWEKGKHQRWKSSRHREKEKCWWGCVDGGELVKHIVLGRSRGRGNVCSPAACGPHRTALTLPIEQWGRGRIWVGWGWSHMHTGKKITFSSEWRIDEKGVNMQMNGIAQRPLQHGWDTRVLTFSWSHRNKETHEGNPWWCQWSTEWPQV